MNYSIKYLETAWNDVKQSPGAFKTILLLGLLLFVPVFGEIVLYGYAYTWAKEIAWKVRRPMPEKVFDNPDGKLYSRGFFALVIGLVFAIVPVVLMLIGQSLGTPVTRVVHGVTYLDFNAPQYIGIALYVIGLAGALLLGLLSDIGCMRMSIYGTIGTGLQLDKVWKMFKHDVKGAFKIFGMELLLVLIMAAVSFVLALVIGLALAATAAGVAGSAVMHGHGADVLFAAVMTLGVGGMLLLLVFMYVLYAYSAFVTLMVARAFGYWVSQFDVPSWRGSKDPMPFETADAAAQAWAQTSWQQQAGFTQEAPCQQASQQQTAQQAPFQGQDGPWGQAPYQQQPQQAPYQQQPAQQQTAYQQPPFQERHAPWQPAPYQQPYQPPADPVQPAAPEPATPGAAGSPTPDAPASPDAPNATGAEPEQPLKDASDTDGN